MNCTELNHKIMCIDSIVENKLDTLIQTSEGEWIMQV